jgi:choloylglycine hydrolase
LASFECEKLYWIKRSVKINGTELSQFGQGSGAIGLPGDFTPPSRFIRAGFLNQVVVRAKDQLANVKRAFKILNQFDIPKGAVREKQGDGKENMEETQWTSAADLLGLKYYYHTTLDRQIRSVDLKKFDFNQKEIKSLKINQPEEIADMTKVFN